MKNKLIYSFIILLFIQFSCSEQSKKEEVKTIVIEEKHVIPETKAKKLFSQLRPKSQFYNYTAEEDHSIETPNGTQIYIPEYSFVDKNGNTIKGKVDIEIIEVLSVADFVKTNLQTVSNGQLLQSEGMIYVDAKANGQAITLAEGKKLQIELPKVPSSNKNSELLIFTGSYDNEGKINWTQSSKPDNKMIPLPADLFDSRTLIAWDSGLLNEASADSFLVFDTIIYKQPHLKGSFIHTTDFGKRIGMIENGDHFASNWYLNEKLPSFKRDSIYYTDSIFRNYYLKNLDKNLYYCDSLAYVKMLEIERSEKFKTWHNSYENYESYFSNKFKAFYEEKLTNVYKFPKDIDLGSKDAKIKLKEAGYSQDKIAEFLGAYARQKAIIKAKRNKEKSQELATNTFSTAKLGWINCDQFYNNPKAKESNIIAEVSNSKSFDFVSLSMIINSKRVALNGILADSLNYTFTGNSAPYTKLPIGEKATIIALSMKENIPYFSKKEFVISETGKFNLELQASSKDEINEKLKGVN